MTGRSAARVSAVLAFALGFAFVGLLVIGGTRPATAGTIVADSGFRPDPDGFSFANYSDDKPYENLDVGEMQRIFGRAVCLTGKGVTCVLNPAARSWLKEMNEAMTGGHCYGMATLAQLIQNGQLSEFGYGSLAAFGGGLNTFGLNIESSVTLQRSIARAFTAQVFPAVVEGAVKGSPKRIVKFLIRNLGRRSRQSWNLSIFQWGMEGGHEITPFAVEDMGEGRFDILVYDNNWPDEIRRVHVDTVKNTWNYYATTKPNQPQAWYRGNAKSKTLSLDPNLEALGTQPCFVCSGRQGANSRYNQVTLSGTASQHARLLITDSKGRSTGFREGRLINRIPGARVVPQTSAVTFAADGTPQTIADSPEPIFLIPKRLKIKIRIDGRQLGMIDRESLGVVGPTFDSAIDQLEMTPGSVAWAVLSPKERTLTLVGPKGVASPRVSFGAESRREAYRITSTALNAPSRSKLFFAKKPRYQLLRIGRKASGNQVWRVGVERDGARGKASFGLKYRLRGRQVAFLYYGPLAVGKRAYIVIADANGNRVKMKRLKKL